MSERSGMFRLFYRKGGDRSTAALMHDNRAALRDLVEAFATRPTSQTGSSGTSSRTDQQRRSPPIRAS